MARLLKKDPLFPGRVRFTAPAAGGARRFHSNHVQERSPLPRVRIRSSFFRQLLRSFGA